MTLQQMRYFGAAESRFDQRMFGDLYYPVQHFGAIKVENTYGITAFVKDRKKCPPYQKRRKGFLSNLKDIKPPAGLDEKSSMVPGPSFGLS